MKLMHLSDLHIGKRVNGFSMIEDQEYILNQILNILDEHPVDGVLMAGDLYDKTVPAAEAVKLFDWFLTSLVKRSIPVYAISGNHDSAERLAFGSQIMDSSHVYFSPVYDGAVRQIILQDNYGTVAIHLLPFLKPATVRHALKAASEIISGANIHSDTTAGTNAASVTAIEEIVTYQDAVKAAVDRIQMDTNVRNVLVAHQFVTGAQLCDSEERSVGGLDNVDATVFQNFDYVALGHIHGPQRITRDSLRYGGTPLKYSFSEEKHRKAVTIVELKEKGTEPVIELIPLKPLHDMRKIRGTYEEVSNLSGTCPESRFDYIHVTLTDEDDVVNGLQKLQVIYPNLMSLDYDNRRTRESQIIQKSEELEQKSELELFEEFFTTQNNQPMSNMQHDYMQKLIETLKEAAENHTC